MRPLLKPALRRVWRDPATLQIGLDPQRAVVLAGMDGSTARFVETLDGTRDRSAAIAAAPEVGVDESTASRLLDLLGTGGVLDDATAGPVMELPAAERDRLRPDLASLSLTFLLPGGSAAALARRARATVQLYGAGRVGACLAGLLSAAGVGRILADDPQPTRPADLSPGGLTAAEVGLRRQDGLQAVVGRARAVPESAQTHPEEADRGSADRGSADQDDLVRDSLDRHVDLAVLAPVERPHPRIVAALMRSGTPHLYLGVREVTGVVGPLVLPGHSSCQRCHDLYRADRDPAWPRIAAQLAHRDGDTVDACDTVLAVAVAAFGALQVLSFLDGERPQAVDGTLEIELPDGLVRRRSWQPHYGCGCTWNLEEQANLEDRASLDPPPGGR